MARHLIFLVHGMGVYSKQGANGKWEPDKSLWHDEQEALLKKHYQDYRSHINIPGFDMPEFDDAFEIVPIVYDQVFTRVLQEWANRADEMLATGVINSLDFVKKIMGWMRSDKLMTEFFFTHFGDVFLYRYFDHFEQSVQANVQAGIVSKLIDQNSGVQRKWSVIGHSLGTKIVHDSIEALYHDSTINIGDEIQPAQVIALIANVCDVLERPDQNVVDSSIYPSGDATNNSACRHLICSSHKWDFFTNIDPYKPKGGRWATATNARRFINLRNIETVDLSAENWWNVHSFKNYIAHPGIHIPLFMKMQGIPEVIFPAAKLDQVVKDYEKKFSINEQFDSQFGDTVKDKRKKLRATLKHEFKQFMKPDLIEFLSQLKKSDIKWSD